MVNNKEIIGVDYNPGIDVLGNKQQPKTSILGKKR